MNAHQHLLLTLPFCLLLVSYKLIPADSRPLISNMEEEEDSTRASKNFEEGWCFLQTAVEKLVKQMEGADNSRFTSENYMSYYSTVYELCTGRQGDKNSKMLYDLYKKVFQEYINSTVLPSLREKKDELLLRELLRRWSNHKIMTMWLSRFFGYLDRYYLSRRGLPSLVETSFFSFYDLVYNEMNKQVVDAIFSMLDQERAGQQIDRTLVNNTLAVYKEIGDGTRKNHAKGFAERMIQYNSAIYYDGASNWISSSSFQDNRLEEEKLHDSSIMSSKKINLISSDGDVFEVDYAVALMSETIEQILKTDPATNSIPLSKVSSRMLTKVIEYCKKHTEASNSKEQNLDVVNLKDWDADFVEVDQDTVFDLVLSSNYLNIRGLLDLASQKIGDMMKGKTQEEIRKTFNIKDNFTPEDE